MNKGGELTEIINDFLQATTLHGYKYLVKNHGHICGRIFWITIIIIALILSVSFMWYSWTANISKPLITTIENTKYPVYRYRFPAVTLCSLNLINKTLAERWLNTIKIPLKYTKEEVRSSISSLATLLDPYPNNGTELLQSILDLNNLKADKVYKRISVKCKDLLVQCRWRGVVRKCQNLFHPVMTMTGSCCAFNFHGTISQKETKSTFVDTVRMSSCGFQNGISVLIRNSRSDYLSTSHGSYGARVIIHDPYNYPGDLALHRLVAPGTVNSFPIVPVDVTTTPDVRDVDIETRDCLFPDERIEPPLRRYSYKNCMLACKMNFALELCGCVPFYNPLINCPRNILFTEQIQTMRMDQRINLDVSEARDEIPCRCRPPCYEILYVMKASRGYLSRRSSFNQQDLFRDTVGLMANYTLVHVHYHDLVGVTYRRARYYNWHKILAALGGLLGLFLGFSFLGAFEVLYFFTFRLFFTAVQKKKLNRMIELNTVPRNRF